MYQCDFDQGIFIGVDICQEIVDEAIYRRRRCWDHFSSLESISWCTDGILRGFEFSGRLIAPADTFQQGPVKIVEELNIDFSPVPELFDTLEQCFPIVIDLLNIPPGGLIHGPFL